MAEREKNSFLSQNMSQPKRPHLPCMPVQLHLICPGIGETVQGSPWVAGQCSGLLETWQGCLGPRLWHRATWQRQQDELPLIPTRLSRPRQGRSRQEPSQLVTPVPPSDLESSVLSCQVPAACRALMVALLPWRTAQEDFTLPVWEAGSPWSILV